MSARANSHLYRSCLKSRKIVSMQIADGQGRLKLVCHLGCNLGLNLGLNLEFNLGFNLGSNLDIKPIIKV